MNNQALSLLEDRVTRLENEVFGEQTGYSNETTIAEALLDSHTMITSALTCRDNIAKVLERLPQLNNYLDPMEYDNQLEIEAKKEYIVLLYSEMKQFGQLLQEFGRLQTFVDSEAIANVPAMDDQLNQIVASNVNAYLDSVQATNNVLSTISKYNGILSNMELLFMQFEKSLNDIEAQLNPKKETFHD